MKAVRLVLLAAVLVATPPPGLLSVAYATVFEPREFADSQQEERYRSLTEELRCLVCQNQSLADSNAELATDLRREVYDMVTDGASEQQVKDFMVSRYSEFVLYRPPIKTTTLLLWAGPFVLAGIGVAALIVQIRRRSKTVAPSALSEGEEERLSRLLSNLTDNQKT